MTQQRMAQQFLKARAEAIRLRVLVSTNRITNDEGWKRITYQIGWERHLRKLNAKLALPLRRIPQRLEDALVDANAELMMGL